MTEQEYRLYLFRFSKEYLIDMIIKQDRVIQKSAQDVADASREGRLHALRYRQDEI